MKPQGWHEEEEDGDPTGRERVCPVLLPEKQKDSGPRASPFLQGGGEGAGPWLPRMEEGVFPSLLEGGTAYLQKRTPQSSTVGVSTVQGHTGQYGTELKPHGYSLTDD